MSEMTRSGRIAVLVPPCMLAPGIQAKEEKDSGWRHSHLQLYLKYQIDILPYPCAESMFQGYENGLRRAPHGIDYYGSLPGYGQHCRRLADRFTEEVLAMQAGGYLFAAVVGIEHSPSCAVSYLYSRHGTLKQSGLFMTAMRERFLEANLRIPFVGINRRHPGKSLREMEVLLQEAALLREAACGSLCGRDHITNG